MKHVELNPSGNFDKWPETKIQELLHYYKTPQKGKQLILANDDVVLWEISLLPGQRLPFQPWHKDLGWTCPNGGLAISRFSSGKILLLSFDKDDNGFKNYDPTDTLFDFENIGESLLTINVIEYKTKKENIEAYKHIA